MSPHPGFSHAVLTRHDLPDRLSITEPVDPPSRAAFLRELAGPGHVCGCRDCDATLRLPTSHAGEHHVGVRFGHISPEWWVMWDGLQVQDVVAEAWAGQRGWVQVYLEHVCRGCGRSACERRLIGTVSVSYRAPRTPRLSAQHPNGGR